VGRFEELFTFLFEDRYFMYGNWGEKTAPELRKIQIAFANTDKETVIYST
jgi:hypothetical protein